MPTIYHYAQANSWYKNHFSCSNGTRSSLFGMFFSVPSYYWDVFESNHQSPVFVDEMLRQGYQCQVYPSATFVNPPFHRVLFQHVKNLNTHTEGDMVYERDSQLTDNFLADLPKRVASGKPFFSLLFYDLAHSCDLPPELRTRFQPAWAYSDYTKLNNGADPMPFFNLYRNGYYQIDQNVNRVLKALEEVGIADNTIVLITGDHAQEFNENKKNYWGHNGNFSRWQIGVPLVYHHASSSNAQPAAYAHRTTHYDIVPTLMQEALGVKNDIADYSVGHQLDDPQPRSWHVVGSELNYAFIIEGDTILEKTADGSLEVTDAKLNPVDNYKLNVKEFNEAIMRLNRYMK
jgi:membrane-anchored protein YejM (alkaline phosphatase superfamily)